MDWKEGENKENVLMLWLICTAYAMQTLQTLLNNYDIVNEYTFTSTGYHPDEKYLYRFPCSYSSHEKQVE